MSKKKRKQLDDLHARAKFLAPIVNEGLASLDPLDAWRASEVSLLALELSGVLVRLSQLSNQILRNV